MSHYLAFAVGIAALTLAGCSAGTVSTSVPLSHPANAAAVQSAFDTTPSTSTAIADSITDHHEARRPVAAAQDVEAGDLAGLVDSYLAIGDALASDSLHGAPEAADALVNAIHALSSTPNPDDPHFWHMRSEQVETIQARAAEVGAASEIRDARVAFGHLSVAVNDIVSALGVPAGGGESVNGFICGMFRDAPQGGLWLQRGDDPRNPYFGSAMSSCNSSTFDVPEAAMAMSEHDHE